MGLYIPSFVCEQESEVSRSKKKKKKKKGESSRA
jgi:hypothetical protein